MKPTRSFDLALIGLGCGLLLFGFGLGLLFGLLDVPAGGPAGLAVAILLGLGLCVVLFATLQRVISASRLPGASGAEPSGHQRSRHSAAASVGRAKLAIAFSVAATAAACALFFGGIGVAFIGFNFATGTNDTGLIMMLTGIVVGLIAVTSGLAAIVLGWFAWKASGTFAWLVASLLLPALQVGAYLAGTHLTK